MIKLICDLNIFKRGHNAGYAQYVVDHVKAGMGDEIFFLFNKSARDIIDISGCNIDSSHFYFTERDFPVESFFDNFKYKEWQEIEAFAELLHIDALLIMELTRYEVQIGRSKVNFKISGIEFRPSHRIAAPNDSLSIQAAAKVQRFKRRFFESILLRSDNIEHIFILNDQPGVAALNQSYRQDVFKFLVDPIFDYGELAEADQTQVPAIDKSKVIYLIFGSLDGRKNISNIFKAFGLMDKSLHKHMLLLVVGKIPNYFEEEFKRLRSEIASSAPELELVIVDEFVSDNLMEYYFSISHVSLLIYARFYGSSGLIGRGAKYNIISLVPKVGLMAELCADYELGYLCDPDLPEDIMRKMVDAYQDTIEGKRVDGRRFYQSHSPALFLEQLNF
jgi:glycosyltransferase involved in cell wall biosynthesis